jgi:hypothetical protein
MKPAYFARWQECRARRPPTILPVMKSRPLARARTPLQRREPLRWARQDAPTQDAPRSHPQRGGLAQAPAPEDLRPHAPRRRLRVAERRPPDSQPAPVIPDCDRVPYPIALNPPRSSFDLDKTNAECEKILRRLTLRMLAGTKSTRKEANSVTNYQASNDRRPVANPIERSHLPERKNRGKWTRRSWKNRRRLNDSGEKELAAL